MALLPKGGSLQHTQTSPGRLLFARASFWVPSLFVDIWGRFEDVPETAHSSLSQHSDEDCGVQLR
eukprot:892653-Amphidinium_carterae.1